MSARWSSLASFVVLACAPATRDAASNVESEPAAQASPPPEPVASDPERPPEPEPPAPPEGDPPPESDPAAPATPDTAALCAASCEAIKGKCAQHVIERCERSCGVYAKMPAACQGLVAEALECVTGAKDRLCIDVAPESCRDQFKAVTECEKTGVAPTVQASAKSADISSWIVHRDPQGGYDVSLPAAPTLGQQNGYRVWTVESSGAKYVVGSAPARKMKSVDAVLLHSTLDFLDQCKHKLKLHGRYDVDGVEHAFFEAPCDGHHWAGEVLLRKGTLFVVGVYAPEGAETNVRELRESFKLR